MAFSGFTVTIRQPLDDSVVDAVREALAKEGFGVLSDIDVAGALSSKLGVEHSPLRILGACNPTVADEALRRDPSVALVLPCNVVLAGEDDTTTVTMADPRRLLDGPDLGEIAERAAERLEAAADHLRERTAVPAAGTAAAPPAEPTPGVASLHRPVGAVATLSPLYGHGDDTLRQLAVRMTEEGIGILLLRRADGDLGAVSERDIVSALANGADPDVVWAEDVMSEELVSFEAGDRIVDAAAELVDRGIRHAPVLEGEEVVGVVSLRDLTEVLVDAALGA